MVMPNNIVAAVSLFYLAFGVYEVSCVSLVFLPPE